VVAYSGAVIHVDAAGAIDEYANQRTAPRQFEVHQLEAKPVDRFLQQCAQFVLAYHKQKMGLPPIKVLNFESLTDASCDSKMAGRRTKACEQRCASTSSCAA
jgi:hypothetical protein